MKDICGALLDCEAPRRPTLLTELCAGDDDLRREVEELLSESVVDRSMLAEPSWEESGMWIGRRLSHYSIIEKIGSGGMGRVYRARDTRLNRDIALKICNGAFSERFGREARAVAALNHPNICTLHDVGDSYLVMELVDGVTLSERIKQGPLTLEECVGIAKQIADALEAAHEKGVIHRDLKPGNIKINPAGIVKVLDFGLAKIEAAPMEPDSPTSPPVDTESGIIMGTPGYMAPEQARGKTVDKRADIWAFGAVLYQMITGRAPFEGETTAEMIAAVLQQEPDLSRVPVQARHLIQRCLEKDPKRRLRDIGDAQWELDRIRQPIETHASSADHAVSSRRTVLLLAVAILLGIAAGAFVWRDSLPAAAPLRRFELPIYTRVVSLSPDGGRIAYLNDGRLQVWALDSLQPQDLGPWPNPSTLGGAIPLFWSPDSKTIAYAADGALRSVAATGGQAFTICKIPATGQMLTGTWLPDGAILFSVFRENLYKVPASGGTPEIYLRVNTETEVDFHHVGPAPEGRVILSTHVRSGNGHFKTEIFDGQRRELLTMDPMISRAAYVSSGYIVFSRAPENSGIWALPFANGPFDLSKAMLVQPDETAMGALFHAANDGTLLAVMPREASQSQLVWVDRSGTITAVPGDSIGLRNLKLSPDGRRAALIVGSESASDLFIRDISSGVDVRLTFDKIYKVLPSWFPAGDRLVYSTRPTEVEAQKLILRSVDTDDDPRELLAGFDAHVSPDGRNILYLRDEAGTGVLRYSPVSSDGLPGESQKIISDADVSSFDLSPDGRLLAYVDRSNRRTLMLTEFPNGKARWEVSNGERAANPRFSRDGRELFYASAFTAGKLMAAPIVSHPAIRIGKPKLVIDMSTKEANGLDVAGGYDVSPDGKRFLMYRLLSDNETTRVVLLQNWLAALKK